VRFANSVGLLRASSSSPIASHEPRTISVKVGRRTLRVEVDRIDWLEARGNYVALHVGRDTHLVRDTLRHFEELLDSIQFVRAHRRIIVAVARIRSIRSSDNGGAILTLDTGQQLVASRRHRRDVRKSWAALSGSPAV
jgi:two-component system LytT family response regulator